MTNIDLQRPAFYDDEGFNYQSYWSNRNYEHKAEVLAIRRLLKGRHFGEAADIDNEIRRYQAQVHGRHQTLAASEHPRRRPMRGK